MDNALNLGILMSERQQLIINEAVDKERGRLAALYPHQSGE